MRDPARIDEVLDQIKILWKESPDQRLFQLLLNYTRTSSGPIEESRWLWLMEDHKLLDNLKKGI